MRDSTSNNPTAAIQARRRFKLCGGKDTNRGTTWHTYSAGILYAPAVQNRETYCQPPP